MNQSCSQTFVLELCCQ